MMQPAMIQPSPCGSAQGDGHLGELAVPLGVDGRLHLHRLEREQFLPLRHHVAGADGRTLLRSASLDLTGMPPTVNEVDAFAADVSPAAFESAVDNLLASPRYVERWARH